MKRKNAAHSSRADERVCWSRLNLKLFKQMVFILSHFEQMWISEWVNIPRMGKRITGKNETFQRRRFSLQKKKMLQILKCFKFIENKKNKKKITTTHAFINQAKLKACDAATAIDRGIFMMNSN